VPRQERIRIEESLSGLVPGFYLCLLIITLWQEVQAIRWEFIIALAIAIPVTLLPAAFV